MQSVTSSRNKKPEVKLQEDARECQENRRPKKPRTHMRPVTNTDNMWLPKPVTRRLCKTETVSLQDASRKLKDVHIQRFQRNNMWR